MTFRALATASSSKSLSLTVPPSRVLNGLQDWLEIIQNHREEEMATDADLDDSYEMIA